MNYILIYENNFSKNYFFLSELSIYILKICFRFVMDGVHRPRIISYEARIAQNYLRRLKYTTTKNKLLQTHLFEWKIIFIIKNSDN